MSSLVQAAMNQLGSPFVYRKHWLLSRAARLLRFSLRFHRSQESVVVQRAVSPSNFFASDRRLNIESNESSRPTWNWLQISPLFVILKIPPFMKLKDRQLGVGNLRE